MLYTGIQFTATGGNVISDVCGDPNSMPLPPFVLNGFHGTSLDVEFRSNRIETTSGFFLAAVCINPAPLRVARQAEQLGFQQRRDCVPSQSLLGSRVGRKKRSIQPLDFVRACWVLTNQFVVTMLWLDVMIIRMWAIGSNLILAVCSSLRQEHVFHIREKRSFRIPWIEVMNMGVVKYEDNTIIVEQGGVVLYKFRNMRVLQVYNRIEGYLTFYGSSTPSGRTFPGYGEHA